MLHDLGCETYQGYLLSRPVPADEIHFDITVPEQATVCRYRRGRAPSRVTLTRAAMPATIMTKPRIAKRHRSPDRRLDQLAVAVRPVAWTLDPPLAFTLRAPAGRRAPSSLELRRTSVITLATNSAAPIAAISSRMTSS